MEKTVVDTLFDEYTLLYDFLLKEGEASYSVIVESNLKKNLILASSSYFEKSITEQILEFFTINSNENKLLEGFLKNKAINRQFHTYFNWTENNANSFFGLFGEEFLTYMKEKVKQDEKLKLSIKSFLELGNERNKIVHQNFASYNVNKTSTEIYEAYISARYFVDKLINYLKSDI